MKLGVDAEDASKLKTQKIDGAHLGGLTEEKMVKLYGISGAAANDIMNGLPDLSLPTDAPGPLLLLLLLF